MVRTKRAYEAADKEDGYRVLVDRLWPRGIRKVDLPIDVWEKELAPSDGLRRWFGHEPERWEEFASRYRLELRGERAARILAELARRAQSQTVTLVYGARDERHNNALVLQEEIERLSESLRESRKSPKP